MRENDMLEIIVVFVVGLFFGSLLEKKFIEFSLDRFGDKLRNTIFSVTKVLEENQESDSDKLKRVKNHLSYLSGEFRQTKNML